MTDVIIYLEALLAEGLPVHLVVSVLAELASALLAREAVGVPVLAHGRHAAVKDRVATTRALGAEHLVVVGLAVGLPVALEVSLGAELLAAVRAHKVLEHAGHLRA